MALNRHKYMRLGCIGGCGASLRLRMIFALILCFLASCSSLVSTSGFNSKPYKFLGVNKITANGDGTFVLGWDNIPKGTASYNVFVKEGTTADPQAYQAHFDFEHPLTRVTENRFVTENVLLKYNICYAVRLIYPKYVDTNTKEICTGHTRLEFAGLESAAPASDGVTLTWSSIPISGIQYLVYESPTSGFYNYNSPTKRLSEESNYKAGAVSLGQTRCYVVRYYKDGLPADTNTKEICVGEAALPDFTGIETATSVNTGSIDVTWKSAGTTIKSYRIYQEVSFTKLIKEVGGDNTTVSISGFTPKETYSFGVRAVDANGREDANTKTISVKIADLSAPTFLGVSQLQSTGAGSFKVKWTGASPQPARYDIFLATRDPLNTQASLNCDLSSNSATCRDMINWNNPAATATEAASEYTFSNIGDDQSVFVAVRAVSASGVADSNVVVKRLILSDNGAPQFDGLVGVELVAGGKAKLSWTAPVGQVSTFNILSTIAGGSGTTTTSIDAMLPTGCTTSCSDVLTEYTTVALHSTTSATFKVQAVDRNGAVDSNTVTRTLVTGDTTPPAMVTAVSGLSLTQNNVTLSFTSPADTDVNKYEVRFEKCFLTSTYPTCSSNTWGSKTLATSTSPASYTPSSPTSVTVSGLDGRSVYRFYVRAVDSSNNASIENDPLTKATIDTTPPSFAGITSAIRNPSVHTGVRVAWSSPGGDVASYVIYRKLSSMAGLTLTSAACTGGVCPNSVFMETATEPTALYDYTTLTNTGDTWYFVIHAIDDQGNEDTNTTQLSYTVPEFVAPVLSQAAVSSASLYASQSTTFTFTAGEAGSYRLLECTANCSGGSPTYSVLSLGSMTTSIKSISLAASAFSHASGTKTLHLELTDALANTIMYTGSSTPAVPTVSINTPIISLVSVNPTSVTDGTTFALGFTPNESGTYRILECAASNCITTTQITTGTATAATPVSLTLDPTQFSVNTGTKILAIEVTDALGNKGVFSSSTTPSVASFYRYAAPINNITNFKILKYNNSGTPTFRLGWTLPASILATDIIRIRKGTTTVPATCTAGTTVADKLYSDTYHEVAVGSDTVNNVSYSAFIISTTGLCATAGSTYGAVWTLTTSVSVNSEGASAQYSVSSNATNATVTTGEARSSAKLLTWLGDNTATVGANGDITDSLYFATNNTSIPTASTAVSITYDYSSNTFHPQWSKRYHRFYFGNATSTNFELTDVYTFAKMPPGMVYVPAAGWPQNVTVTGSSPSITESYPTSATMGDWDAVPHDYAVDKYETSLASGTLGSPTTFPNSETGVLVSANAAPYGDKNWYAHKQGCLNRTYDASYSTYVASGDLPAGTSANQSKNSSTVINNPRRKFHLASGVEWVVAAYGTPDQGGQDYCNIDNRGSPTAAGSASPADTGTSSTINCKSTFGARNMIGNLTEWTDDWAKNGKLGGVNKWNGTTAEGMSAVAVPNSATLAWNFRAQAKLLSAVSVAINNDSVGGLYEEGGTKEGGYGGGDGWAALRGGPWSGLSGSGRFQLQFSNSPYNYYVNSSFGGRCTLVAPQLKPLVARFASDSNATTTKLSWVTLDTEDSTTIKLASAADKATIDTFDGTNTPAGVAISSIALDTTTGKHIGAGGCENTYTPKAAGFESETNAGTQQDTYYSGKYCATASGTKYYKLCATNPSIAQVTDDYTSAQRTTCSAVVAVVATQSLPSLVAYSNGAKLQNDSDGPFARFYFNVSGGTNVVAKLVYGVNLDQVKRYNGDDSGFSGFDTGTISGSPSTYYGTLSGVKTLTIPAGNTRLGGGGTADCDSAEYNPSTTLWGVYEPFTGANGVTATHFVCVNMSAYPKWTKMFFKVIMANTDGAGNITSGWVQSAVRGAGYVPTGMVYVTREEWKSIKNGGEDYTSWPMCIGAITTYPTMNHVKNVMPGAASNNNGTTACVYDYAMDKYEVYLPSSSLTTGTFNTVNTTAGDYNTSVSNASSATAASTMTGNTSTGILLSAKAKTAANGASWFGFKKGCDNRTTQIVTQGFLTNNSWPFNNVRLPTGQEWTVAAYNTPDDGNANTTCTVASTNTAQTTVAQGGAFDGTGGMPKCVSTFGSYDHIGNVWEWTDEVTVDGSAGSSTNFYHLVGTSQATAFPATGNGSIPSAITTLASDNWVSTWDYLTGFISATAGSGTSYYYRPSIGTTGPPAGGTTGANWTVERGGSWNVGFAAGRFTFTMRSSPNSSGSNIGGRCSMAVP